ncbi:MAG: hypothetical protein HQK68_11305 [Desulfamplus sp.]|nr:hypothetical protein [Desulfamplus sp.]
MELGDSCKHTMLNLKLFETIKGSFLYQIIKAIAIIKGIYNMENTEFIADIKEFKKHIRKEEFKKLDDFIKERIMKIKSDRVFESLYYKEQGDAGLFYDVFKHKFVYNASTGCWMAWFGSFWYVHEELNDVIFKGVDALTSLYGREADRLLEARLKQQQESQQPEQQQENDAEQQEYKDRDAVIYEISQIKNRTAEENLILKLYKRITSFWEGARYKTVIERVRKQYSTRIQINNDYLDCNPYQLPCRNGTISLHNGHFRESKQTDYNTKLSPVEWIDLDTPCKTWEKTLLEVFSGDQDVVDCFQRVCGFALIGAVVEVKAILMTGKGSNGKTMIMEIIQAILGDLASPIPAEMLLEQQQARNPAAPSPDIMLLKGRRLVIASETKEGRHLDIAKLKWITGGDTLTGRNPHDTTNTNFKPSHTLFLLTNNKPHAPANEFSLWRRIIVFPFELSYVDREPTEPDERKEDKTLKKRLLDTEASGILAWLVRGCLEWQRRGGIDLPPKLQQEIKQYQRDEDVLQDFIDECCLVRSDYNVPAKDLYSVFKTWWIENQSTKTPSGTWFGKNMGKKFKKSKSSNIVYCGITTLNPTPKTA